MAKLSSLLDYYYESMYADLKVLENERLRIVTKLKKAIYVLIILGMSFCFFLIQSKFLIPLHAFALTFMVAFLIYMFIYRHEIAGYKSLFKDNIIEKVIHFIDPSLVYDKEHSILESEYQQSGIFSQNYDKFSGSDLVSGVINGVKTRFSTLHVEEKRKDKDGKEHWYTLFQGLFFIVDFNKDFKSKTFVFPDFAERSLGVLGSWMQSLNTSKGELIKLDNSEFEKFFVVYGDDQIESRYILSHTLMEKIINFKNKNKKNLSLSFVNSKMYLCVDYNKELFEPILTKSLLKFSQIKEYFELLSMIIGIVEEFKLGEKIWSKR